MNGDYSVASSDYRLEKAKDLLAQAELLLKDKRFDGCVNRSYYTIFSAIRAMLALAGIDSRKHSGVISFFDRYTDPILVFPGILSAVSPDCEKMTVPD